MKIGTCRAKRGSLTQGELQVAVDPEGREVYTPVVIARGKQDGKTMFLSAGVHGDELNGIVVLQRFIRTLDATALRGSVIFLPLVNVAGFRRGQRNVPYDDRDLNRCFPGAANGTVSEQIAHTVFQEVVACCDFGIDVHDSGIDSVLLPHARAHIRDEAGDYDHDRMDPIAAFGTDIIMLCRGADGVMTIEAGRHLGVPAFTVEIGGAGILWDGFIHRAVTGLRNVLVHQGMLDGKMLLPREQYVIPGEDDVSIRAPIEGVLELETQLGHAVGRGEWLAQIHDPIASRHEVIRAGQCGVVHDLNVHAHVDVGDAVVGILEFTTCPERGRRPSPGNVETIINEASDSVALCESEVFEEALTLTI
ncbi:succinylglutamate desuccinylase/aspartoacylase family protein [Candidatus Poribacteria bacterium]|jgi:uncharacterized protein|nr:succinylglutamate desuccinylase/aspartoacylase family protein [Candidatus Poribacteria bacterium]